MPKRSSIKRPRDPANKYLAVVGDLFLLRMQLSGFAASQHRIADIRKDSGRIAIDDSATML